MKRINLYRCFIAAILVLSISFPVGTVLFGPSTAGANEQLAKPPVLIKNGKLNDTFLSDAMQWYTDHAFLRQELISLNNLLSAKLFRTSGADSVILGKDGWLYYGYTLGDYTGDGALTEKELYAVANNLALMNEYVSQKGEKFLFVPVPNKNTLYPEQMPSSYKQSDDRSIFRLMAKLKTLQVPYADLYAAFKNENEPLYFAHDSHWNPKGAALGADVINSCFDVESDYYSDGFAVRAENTGDLYNMLYPAFKDPETKPTYGGTLLFEYTDSGKAQDSIILKTRGQGSGTLLAYRDSFGNLLYPYLADTYADATFSRSTVYDLTGDADFVLVEIVERNLRYLISNVPIMESPVRQIDVPDSASGTISVKPTSGKAPQGCVQLSGHLEADGKMYVVCSGIAYEAFLLRDNRFAVNVPADAQPEAVVYTAGESLKKINIQ